MGQSQPFDRELALTDATVSLVAKRQRGQAGRAEEAQRMLRRFPTADVTVAELSAAIEQIQSKNLPVYTSSAGSAA